MRHRVTLYEIPRDAGPRDEPQFVETFHVMAGSTDGARREAKRRLVEEGRVLRAMSVLVDGGISAIAYPKLVSHVDTKKRGDDGEAREVGAGRKGRGRHGRG